MRSADVYRSKWQRGADLRSPVLRTIDRVELKAIGRGSDVATKPVVSFREQGALPMICNAGNWRAIAAIAGDDDSDNWGGVRIVLYQAQVEYAGQLVAGIRIRAPKPNAAPARPTPPPAQVSAPTDDEIGF